jgi:allantoinase
MDDQLFVGQDRAVDGLPRELVGYGEHPPRVQWPGDAKVAVQIVVNYEEGSERSFPMGDGCNDPLLYELPYSLEGVRDMGVESVFEYGSRAGIWRFFRIFDAAGIPVTFFASAVALERNPAVAEKLALRRDEPAGHGYRWSNHYEMTREEEAEVIRRAVASIERTTGSRPLGWFSRKMSPHTRELLVEEGGFVYDSESFNDDLPYWTRVDGKPHLVVPYTMVFNDARFVLPMGYASPADFLDHLTRALDRLRDDGDDCPRMMSVGLHPRTTGNPARAEALARFIDYGQSCGDVWFARRIDIAETFSAQYPAESMLGA